MGGGLWIGLRELAQSVGILYHTSAPNRGHSPKWKTVKRTVGISKPLFLATPGSWGGLMSGAVLVTESCPWPTNTWDRLHSMGSLLPNLVELLLVPNVQPVSKRDPYCAPDILLSFKENRQPLDRKLITLDIFCLGRAMIPWWHQPINAGSLIV